MKAILTAILAIIFFTGCRTTTETVYVDRFKDRYIERIDSVYIYNTDSVRIEIKGDTVYNTTTRTKYRDRIRIQKDTVNQIVRETKTITVEKTKIKKVYWPSYLIIGLFFAVVLLCYYLKKKALFFS